MRDPTSWRVAHRSELGHPVTVYYDCVTNARDWLSLTLQHNHHTIDNRRYQLDRLPELLGVFQQIPDFYRIPLANVPS